MRKEKVEIVVKNKLTYLWLISVPVGIGKLIYDYINAFGKNGTNNIAQFGLDAMISILILILGVIIFFKLNIYSNWMNPDHPKHN